MDSFEMISIQHSSPSGGREYWWTGAYNQAHPRSPKCYDRHKKTSTVRRCWTRPGGMAACFMDSRRLSHSARGFEWSRSVKHKVAAQAENVQVQGL